MSFSPVQLGVNILWAYIAVLSLNLLMEETVALLEVVPGVLVDIVLVGHEHLHHASDELCLRLHALDLSLVGISEMRS